MKIGFPRLLMISAVIMALVGCSSDDTVQNNPRQEVPPIDYTFAHFDPAAGDPSQIPVPNDILRNPATGQLALPLTGDPAVDALIGQVNTLSGFSTTAPFRMPFVGKVDPDTVNNSSILVVDLVDLAAAQGGAQVNPFRQVRFDVRDDASGENSVIFGMPVTPLKPGRPHLVVVTRDVIGSASNLPVESEAVTIILKGETPLVDGAGNSLRASLSNEQAQALEPLRIAYQQIWQAAEGVTGQDRLFIPFAFAFSTQPLFETMTTVRERAQAEEVRPQLQLAVIGNANVDALLNSVGLGNIPHDSVGAMFFGSINVPNYINDPLNGPFNGVGENLTAAGRIDVNFIAALPEGPGPFPTLIFQHGITGFKEQGLAAVEAATSQGVAVIGIDLVLHGERTGDLINNETGAPGPDGVPDPSGVNFINLTNLLVSRDNVRQSVSDLFHLTRMISGGFADFNGDGQPEMAPQGIMFGGISLGGIVGTVFTATEPNVTLGALNVPGGRIAYLLNQSQTFGPAIDAGLSQFGLVPGSPLYDLYFLFTQTIVDDADPLNYAPHLSTGALSAGVSTSVIVQEQIGDAVIPNITTRDLARAAGVAQVAAVDAVDGLEQVAAPYQGSGYYQFPEGGHGALLDPTPPNPTVAVQTQFYTFLLTGLLGQPTVIDPLAAPAKGALDAEDGVDMNIREGRLFYIEK